MKNLTLCGQPSFFFFNSYCEGLLCLWLSMGLAVEADLSNLESKLLAVAAKVCWSNIYNGEQLCWGGDDL